MKKTGRFVFAAVAAACMLMITGMCALQKGIPVYGAEEEEALRAKLHADGAVLLDMDSGRVLFEKNGDKVLAMASTTKIMTCITALENGEKDDIVEVSGYASAQPKVHLGMQKGERYKMEDLLYSLMLESHNDSAVAIAEHIGAKNLKLPPPGERTKEESMEAVKAFCTLMNRKAGQMGCINTCFLTPNGLDASVDTDRGITVFHSTTAKELAKIMDYCVTDSGCKEEFLAITGRESYSFTDCEGKRRFDCRNHNAFLKMMEGAISGKTGFTGKAGYCYVGALERDGKHLALALLACGWPNHKTWKWTDAGLLFQYGLEHYNCHRYEEVQYDERVLAPIEVLKGKTERIGDTCMTDVSVKEIFSCGEGVLLKDGEKIEVTAQVRKNLTAPVKAGAEAGEITYRVDGKIYKKMLLITTENVEKINFLWCFSKIFVKFHDF